IGHVYDQPAALYRIGSDNGQEVDVAVIGDQARVLQGIEDSLEHIVQVTAAPIWRLGDDGQRQAAIQMDASGLEQYGLGNSFPVGAAFLADEMPASKLAFGGVPPIVIDARRP